MKFKHIIVASLLALGAAAGFGASMAHASDSKVAKAAQDTPHPVTKIYIEDQVSSGTNVLSVEAIAFEKNYGHEQFMAYLTEAIGPKDSYDTTVDVDMPSAAGWSYMSSSETEKYLICPTGSINFTLELPEWVTYLKYKAVGNKWHNWFDVNGSAIELRSDWGIGHQLNSYIFNDSGWKMNVNLGDATTKAWGERVNIYQNYFNPENYTGYVTSNTDVYYYLPFVQDVHNFGIHSGEFYSDAEMTQRVYLITPNTPTTLYVKILPTQDFAEIYVQMFSTTTYVYAFDSESIPGFTTELFGPWPGLQVNDCTSDVNFCGEYYNPGLGNVGHVSVNLNSSLSHMKLIINDNGSHQSGAQSIAKRNYYFNHDDATTGDESLGKGAEVVLNYYNVLKGLPNKSFCSLTGNDPSTQTLYNEYNNGGYNSKVNATTFYMYSDTEYSNKENYTLTQIATFLGQRIAETSSQSNMMVSRNITNEAMLTIIVIGFISMTIVAALFAFKKRKQN